MMGFPWRMNKDSHRDDQISSTSEAICSERFCPRGKPSRRSRSLLRPDWKLSAMGCLRRSDRRSNADGLSHPLSVKLGLAPTIFIIRVAVRAVLGAIPTGAQYKVV